MTEVNTQEVFDKVAAIVASTLHIDEALVVPQATFDSLGADSLDKLEIVMKIEEAFSIEINDEEASRLTCVQQAVDAIAALKK